MRMMRAWGKGLRRARPHKVPGSATSAIITITVTGRSGAAYAAMQTSGSASIVAGVGLAAVSPPLLRLLATPLRPLLARSGTTYLAAESTTRRPGVLAGILAPVIVLVSTSIGTLLMIGIDARTLDAAGDPEGVGGTITTINSVVIGMICLFAATFPSKAVGLGAPAPCLGAVKSRLE